MGEGGLHHSGATLALQQITVYYVRTQLSRPRNMTACMVWNYRKYTIAYKPEVDQFDFTRSLWLNVLVNLQKRLDRELVNIAGREERVCV